MTVTTQFKRSDRHIYRHVAGEHMLIAIHRDTVAPMFSLTPTAAALWKAMADWASPADLVDALTNQFDVDAEQASADVTEFLEQLRQIGAVSAREVSA